MIYIISYNYMVPSGIRAVMEPMFDKIFHRVLLWFHGTLEVWWFYKEDIKDQIQ